MHVTTILFKIVLLFSIQSAGASNCSNTIFTPYDRPGPELSVSLDLLSKALTCFGDLRHITPNDSGPILLVPGTGVKSASAQYSLAWTLELSRLEWPYCLIDPPDYGLGDIQISGEYIVYAIRTMYRNANNHRINIIGHSQGGMTPRWALRFWPDTRLMVNNMIGLAPANYPVEVPLSECSPRCVPARWQFRVGSQAMCAVNSYRDTFDEQIAYTQILTQYDEAIRPVNASELSGGANIYIQDICVHDHASHVGIAIYDQIAYMITMDALVHNGSASLSRIKQQSCQNQRCCQQLYMETFNQSLLSSLNSEVFISIPVIENYPQVTEEPKSKCYVFKDCVLRSSSSPTIAFMTYHIIIVALILILRNVLEIN